MLERLLLSLGAQTLSRGDFELIVVDDGSVDTTPDVLKRARERDGGVRVIRESGRGRAAARNRGWTAASAPLVAFTDDDCVASPTWLESLVARAEQSPGSIVEGLTDIDPRQVGEVGPYSRTLQIREPGPYFATCNILYPKEILERVGGFDERYPRAEDTDLGWRARGEGAGYVFVPEAVIFHEVVHLGAIGRLRWAFQWSDAMQVFRDHPGLRDVLTWGLFWKRSHALLAVALAGAMLSRRFPPAALLCLPYVKDLLIRCRHSGFSAVNAPYLALYDITETVATAKGAATHRVPVL